MRRYQPDPSMNVSGAAAQPQARIYFADDIADDVQLVLDMEAASAALEEQFANFYAAPPEFDAPPPEVAAITLMYVDAAMAAQPGLLLSRPRLEAATANENSSFWYAPLAGDGV